MEDVEAVFALAEAGLSRAEISRAAIRSWLADGPAAARRRRGRVGGGRPCVPEHCAVRSAVAAEPYAYLLGLYLGDGCISAQPRGVYRLRIQCTSVYQEIIDQCVSAMAMVLPNTVAILDRGGCVEVGSSSKHWPCLFPQHGSGMKHLRSIVLEPWQRAIVQAHPKLLLRGLIHSDGCRDLNPVNGKEYPRYQFSNRSADVRRIFTDTCDLLSVRWRENRWVVSVARRPDVAFLDSFIGPKA